MNTLAHEHLRTRTHEHKKAHEHMSTTTREHVTMDWQSLIKGFKEYMLLERSFSENSIDAYHRDINKFVEYLQISGHEKSPLEIEAEDVRQFVFSLNDMGLGARSQGRILSGVKAFYKYLLLEDITDNDPTALLEGPRLARKIPEVMTVEEVQTILASIDLSTDHGTRNRAMLEVLYACGLRVSELTHLRISNLFLDVGFIKVIGKNDKERLIPIGEEAKKHILIYKEEVRKKMKNIKKGQEDILFLNRRGNTLTRIMLFYIVKEAAAAAGLDKNVSPHTFRHSFATHLIEGGADLKAVQDMLGHESITTTEIYTHLDTDYLRETVLMYHPRNIRKDVE